MENKLLKEFISSFEGKWEQFINGISDSINVENSQIYSGNRLRPQLVFWGYYIGCEHLHKDCKIDDIASISISFEAIHKASIIIDDIIDKDELRKGIPTFHYQFGIDNAIIYAILLLINSLKIIQNEKIKLLDGYNIILSIINTMCLGALSELNSPCIKTSINKTLEIVNCETVTLIRSCLESGYKYSQDTDKELCEVMGIVGDAVGYIFQMLNDAEPFFNPNYIQRHKGKLNYDFNVECKKNCLISYLCGVCSNNDLKNFDTINFCGLLDLLNKYKVKEFIMDEIDKKNTIIEQKMSSLNLISADEFLLFYKHAISLGKNRALFN